MSAGTGGLFWDRRGCRPPFGTAGTSEIDSNPPQMTSGSLGPPWPRSIFSICTISELIAVSVMCPTRVDTYFGLIPLYILSEIKVSSTTLSIQALKHAKTLNGLAKWAHPPGWLDVSCTSCKMYRGILQGMDLGRIDALTPSPESFGAVQIQITTLKRTH